jgi:hypothetical protein
MFRQHSGAILRLRKQLLNFCPMEFRFTPNEEDWMNANRGAPREGRVWDTVQFVLTFVPLFFLGAGLAASGFSAAGWFCVGSSIVIALAAYEVPRARLRRRFRATPRATEERGLTIGKHSIAAISPTGSWQFVWQAFAQYRETKTSFLLLTTPYTVGLYIPKREMSPEQIKELREMLKIRLSASSAASVLPRMS